MNLKILYSLCILLLQYRILCLIHHTQMMGCSLERAIARFRAMRRVEHCSHRQHFLERTSTLTQEEAVVAPRYLLKAAPLYRSSCVSLHCCLASLQWSRHTLRFGVDFWFVAKEKDTAKLPPWRPSTNCRFVASVPSLQTIKSKSLNSIFQ